MLPVDNWYAGAVAAVTSLYMATWGYVAVVEGAAERGAVVGGPVGAVAGVVVAVAGIAAM